MVQGTPQSKGSDGIPLSTGSNCSPSVGRSTLSNDRASAVLPLDVDSLQVNDGAVVSKVVMEQDENRSSVEVHTLADLVPAAAQRFPDRPAIAAGTGDLSYDDVLTLTQQLAAGFAGRGVERGDRVVLSMHKTADSYLLIHSLLAVGAVVVPLDPLMPVSAAHDLLRSIGPASVIVDQAAEQRFGLRGQHAVPLPRGLFTVGPMAEIEVSGADDASPSASIAIEDFWTEPSSDWPLVAVSPDDPAYVIFTSGSTGAPKGITHTHRSGLAYARLAVETHGINPTDRLAGLPPLHFDMSTLELYAAPLAGAAIVPIGSAELRFPATFSERSEHEHITIWYSVPFQLRQISERGAIEQRDLSSLRHVIYAGEAFSMPALVRLMEQLPHSRFTNAYGPAETNVCTVYELTSLPTNGVPIGRPWGDVVIRVAEPGIEPSTAADLIDVTDGDLGELWVRAESTMVGYLHRPDLTAERCLADAAGTWYRTGDLVRRDPEGELWLAGRLDHQVKVRGTRLELEAIEAVLVANPDVSEAVVAPATAGPTIENLVAAVVLDTETLDHRSFRRWCLSRLPQVAVPATVSVWDDFPLTSSGKIDRSTVRRALLEASDSSTNGTDNV